MKLISGQKNALLTICKPGYAEGVQKPYKAAKVEIKPLVIRIRRQEGLVA